jgi:hypothetical protein
MGLAPLSPPPGPISVRRKDVLAVDSERQMLFPENRKEEAL